MPFKVQVGPPQIAIHQAQTVLVTDPDGQIELALRQGAVFLRHPADQRLGGLCQRRSLGPAERRRDHLRHRAHLPDQPQLPHRGRHGAGAQPGLRHRPRDSPAACMRTSTSPTTGRKPVRFNLEIAIRSDFADVFEVKSGTHRPPRPHHHRVVGRAPEAAHHLPQPGFPARGAYRHAHEDQRAAYANGRLSFEVRLDPGRPGIAACSTT